MKLIAIWIAVLGLAAAAAASCSINHRSGDFACQTQGDCSSNRICVDGSCVVGTPAPPDAGGDAPPIVDARPDAPPVDATLCPAPCTSCDLGLQRCTIDCADDPATCMQPITCPPGWNCDVQCTTRGSCRAAINCAGESCTLTCSGLRSCSDVTCTTGDCDVRCIGPGSCESVNGGPGTSTVTCDGDGSCGSVNGGPGTSTVTCDGDGSCSAVACGPGACTVGCQGEDTCGDVTCGDACSCAVDCLSVSSCTLDPLCKEGCDSLGGDGCTARRAGCNTCP